MTAPALSLIRARTLRRVLILCGLMALVAVSFVASIAVGPLDYSFSTVVTALVSPESVDARTATVVWSLRLPPAVLALLVGASLSLGGVQMQTILDNPLAEPFTLGVSAAAAFGASVAIVFTVAIPFAGPYSVTVLAGGTALLTSLIIAGASFSRGAGAETVILFGIAMVFLFQALLSLMQYNASTESLQQIVFWTMGSLQRANVPAIIMTGCALAVAIPLLMAQGWKLTAMRFGDARARALGISVQGVRISTLVVVSVLAAVSVSFVGIIGFIGLVGPHVARMLVGEDQRFLMPASILTGAAFLSCAHAASQVLIPGVVVPVGILTALIGVPLFLTMIFGRRARGLA